MPAIRDLPSAVDRAEELADRLRGRTAAVFCDYDGVLAGIVPDPRDATLPPETRAALERLAARVPLAIVSGRDLDDVRSMVGLEGIAYAGSHGFDIVDPQGQRHERAPEALPALDAAERRLAVAVGEVPGASVERKRFAVAVHFRQVEDPARVEDLEAAVDEAVAAAGGALRKTGGKKIFEVRPGVDWDKGKALLLLLDVLGLDRPDVVPLYLGDDLTDEDAFEVIRERGIGVVVRGEDDGRPTAARYSLDAPAAVRDLLDRLAEDVAGR